MEEKIIEFETAKLAKEKGFDLPCPHCYMHNDWDGFNNYIIELFSYFLGGDGFLNEIYQQDKEIKHFDINDIESESQVYFNYNQDIRKLLALKYNGEEYMNDEKSFNMYIDSFTYDKWSFEETEKQKKQLPNYNDGDFDFGVYQDVISAPSQSLLQKWLRDVHGIDIMVKTWTGDIKGEKTYASDVYLFGTIIYIKLERVKTYEEALEKGLFEAIKLI